ncbi:MAG: type II secretion system protein N [Magnetococcales bacterium]|nr:type II secretion system protein N [Magnetococcales bacterium]
MMGIKGYLALGAASYLFFLLASFPASLVWSWLAIPPETLVLEEISGTPWSGRAARVVVAHFEMGPLQWRLRTDSLWHLAPQVDLTLAGGENLHLRGSVKGEPEMILTLQDLVFSSPLSSLSPLLVRIPVDLTGQLDFQIKQLAINREGRIIAIKADGTLNDLAVGIPWDKALGGYAMEAVLGIDGEVLIHIKDIEGVVRTALVLKIHPDGRYLLRGSLRAGKNMDDSLANLLKQWIGFERNKTLPVRAEGHLGGFM